MSQFKAVIKGKPSKVMDKNNEAQGKYVLINCLITEGPAKDMEVTGTFTILNRDGEVKEVPSLGDEVMLHHTVLPSTTEPGKFRHFFEIGSVFVDTDHDKLTELLGSGGNPGAFFGK